VIARGRAPVTSVDYRAGRDRRDGPSLSTRVSRALAVDESVTIGSCDRRVGTHFAARPKVAAALNQNV
jgi:hypothetical protein